jgi:hypothetical protein
MDHPTLVRRATSPQPFPPKSRLHRVTDRLEGPAMTEDRRRRSRPRRVGSPSAAVAAAQVLSRLADLAKASVQAQATLARHSVDLAWATVAGSLDRTSANKAYIESVTRESIRYWVEVGELSVDYATDLVALGKSVSSTVLREVAAAGRRPGTRHTPRIPVQEAGGRPVELSLAGPVGGRAEGTITVANQYRGPRRIRLNAGDLVDSAGVVVGAGLDISPTMVTVPSGQERSVSLGVDLDHVSFLPGQKYSSTVEVRGCGEATIEVSVEASA